MARRKTFVLVLRKALTMRNMIFVTVSLTLVTIAATYTPYILANYTNGPRVSEIIANVADTHNWNARANVFVKTTPERNWTETASFFVDRTPKVKPVDLMQEGPFHFLPNYKNPCWYSTRHVDIHSPPICLPYVFLIGAPKCGTSDIYARIVAHPDVAKPAGKEPHWITRGRFGSVRLRTLHSYAIQVFGKAAEEIYKSVDKNDYHNKITGDFSASTLFDNRYWKSLPGNEEREEPLHTTADYIHHINPDTKILVILRDPIERLYSDFLYFNRILPNDTASAAKTFHRAVQAFILRWTACLKIRAFQHCLYASYNVDTPGVRPRIGLYSEHIAEYLRVFPRDQLLVVKMEEYSVHPAATMGRVFDFLNITQLNVDEMGRIADADIHRNQNIRHKTTNPMWNSTRSTLDGFYKHYNDKLATLLGDETFNYNHQNGILSIHK